MIFFRLKLQNWLQNFESLDTMPNVSVLFLCEKGISLEAFNWWAVQYVSNYSRITYSYCCPQERAEKY